MLSGSFERVSILMLSCRAVFKSFENSSILKQGFFPPESIKEILFYSRDGKLCSELSEGKHAPKLDI